MGYMAAVIYYSRKKINKKMGFGNILAAMLAPSIILRAI